MDYSQLSDFEINKRVAKAICSEFSINPINREIYAKGGKERFNPCNNPADAWPIIIENRIAIIPDTAAGEWVAFNEFTLYEGDWMFASDPTHHSNGKKPLRCAMETFLMMQDAKHA
ncbi:TPA: DUF2591 domain-containing protein [Escherichia coli]|nr:DUF2591 domain-containing protein [Escherichia coli]HAJ4256177.1 DUF2591 domain-containing protein [Escherichia coli]HAJ4382478.1 DUF2591 domain-containing protein [Escherichia coli]